MKPRNVLHPRMTYAHTVGQHDAVSLAGYPPVTTNYPKRV